MAHRDAAIGRYRTGGRGGWYDTKSLASAELYDPATGTWRPTGSMTTGRNSIAILLQDGTVLVVGGSGGSNTLFSVLASAELYDPAKGTWRPTGDLSTARDDHTATLLQDGTVLVVGGKSESPANAEIYDPAKGTWRPTGDLSTARDDHTATLLQDGTVLVVGGADQDLPSAELYDPATGTWRPTGSMTTARPWGHTATLLSDGTVLVVGGIRNDEALASAEVYTPSARPVQPSPTPTP